MKANNPLKFRLVGNLRSYDSTYYFLNDYGGEAKFIISVLKKQGIKIGEASFLDLGCGTGNLFYYMKDFKKLVGVDISSKAIEIAKNKSFENAQFIVGDITTISLKEKFSGIYISTYLLQTFPDIKKVIKFLFKIKTWLKKNGLIFFTWLDEQIYKKRFKDGKSNKIFINKEGGLYFRVFTKSLNQNKRYFSIRFYQKRKLLIWSEAIYLKFWETLIKNIAKKINMKVNFKSGNGLREDYQRWAILSIKKRKI